MSEPRVQSPESRVQSSDPPSPDFRGTLIRVMSVQGLALLLLWLLQLRYAR